MGLWKYLNICPFFNEILTNNFSSLMKLYEYVYSIITCIVVEVIFFYRIFTLKVKSMLEVSMLFSFFKYNSVIARNLKIIKYSKYRSY